MEYLFIVTCLALIGVSIARRNTSLEDFKIPYLDLDLLEW